MARVHHEQCFGCGRTNLFGLLLEVEEVAPGAVAGRCFIKQDHQGAEGGRAHDGVVAAALSEAMSLACGVEARAVSFEVSLYGRRRRSGRSSSSTPRVESRDGPLANATATATADRRVVAQATGRFRS